MRRHDYQSKTTLEFGADSNQPLTDEDVTNVCHDLKHRRVKTQAAITGTIKAERHGEMEVVCEEWGLNHPTFRTSDGRRLFLSAADDAEDLRLLFKEKYDGTGSLGYKYIVESVELDIHWHRQPSCPVCGEPLTYGMVNWDPAEGKDGFMSGWLCEECIPSGVRVEEGLR